MEKRKVKNIVIIFLVFVAFFGVAAAYAHATQDPQPIVNVNFPCPNCAQNPSDITTYINTFYQFSLWIGGALALGMIVAGGVIRIVSAGSPDRIREATDMITSALFGLVLLFGAYLVLNTVNPQLTILKLPTANQPTTQTSQLVETLASTDCVSSSTQTFENIPIWDGTQRIDMDANGKPIPTFNCYYRRTLVPQYGSNVTDTALTITNDGLYYDQKTNIQNGSTVWLYPYFPSNTDPVTNAKCLIYAFRGPTDNVPTMINLNPTLSLCTPKEQSLEAPGCGKWTYYAKRGDSSGLVDWDSNLGPYTKVTFAAAPEKILSGGYTSITNPPQNVVWGNGLLSKTDYRCYAQKSDGSVIMENPATNGTYTCKDPVWTCTDVVPIPPPSTGGDKTTQVLAGAGCDSQGSCATKYGYGSGYQVKNAPDLDALINGVNTAVPAAGSITRYTFEQTTNICNYTRGNPGTPRLCAHAVNSCHYGGGSGKDGAEAVDYSATGSLGQKIIDAANNYLKGIKKPLNGSNGAPRARCEDASGTRIDCYSIKATHVHISAPNCDKN